MSHDTPPKSDTARPTPPSNAEDRLAAKLRENLARRKAQQRARKTAPGPAGRDPKDPTHETADRS